MARVSSPAFDLPADPVTLMDCEPNCNPFEQESEWPAAELAELHRRGVLAGDDPVHARWTLTLKLLQRIGYDNLTVGRIVDGHLNGIQLCHTFGHEQQKQRLNEATAAGQLSAIWDSEIPGQGLTIRRIDDHTIELNGTKHFASAAGKASLPVVTAMWIDEHDRDSSPGDANLRQMLLLPMEQIDATIKTDREPPIGVRGAHTFSVRFEEQRVDASALLGAPGDYLREPWLTAGAARFIAIWTGAMQRLLELVRLDHQRYAAASRTAAVSRAARLAAIVQQAEMWTESLASDLDNVVSICLSASSAHSLEDDTAGILRGASKQARIDVQTEQICAKVLLARHAVEELGHQAMRLAEQAIGLKGMVPPHPLQRCLRDLTVYLRQPATDTSLDRAGAYVLNHSSNRRSDQLWSQDEIDDASRLLKESVLDPTQMDHRYPIKPTETVHQFGRTVVVAPHADDETLGCGGIVAALRQAGLPVRVIYLTDSSGSHPGSRKFPPEKIASLRRREAIAACAVLGVDDVHFLDLPDGKAPQSGEVGFESAASSLNRLLKEFEPHTLLTTWRRDRHGDHRSAYAIATEAAKRFQPSNPPRVLEFPVWVHEARSSNEAPRDNEVDALRIDVRGLLKLKQQALQQHQTQLGGVIDDDPDGFVLTPRILQRFSKDWEWLLLPKHPMGCRHPATNGQYFDQKYSKNPDPWSYETSAYEKQKYDRTLDALGRQSYESALELGCSIGVLTQRLSDRCDSLVAVDGAQAAVDTARKRLAAEPTNRCQVLIRQARLPEALSEPELAGPFDLIVVSEIGYYFSLFDLVRLREILIDRLTVNGEILLVHWTVFVNDYPLTGDQVHECFCDSKLTPVKRQRFPYYRIDRLRKHSK